MKLLSRLLLLLLPFLVGEQGNLYAYTSQSNITHSAVSSAEKSGNTTKSDRRYNSSDPFKFLQGKDISYEASCTLITKDNEPDEDEATGFIKKSKDKKSFVNLHTPNYFITAYCLSQNHSFGFLKGQPASDKYFKSFLPYRRHVIFQVFLI